MGQPEENCRPPDGDPGAEKPKDADPEAAEEELLGERTDQDDNERIRDECARPVRLQPPGARPCSSPPCRNGSEIAATIREVKATPRAIQTQRLLNRFRPSASPHVHRIRIDDGKREHDHDRVDDGAADSELPTEERFRVTDGVVIARCRERERDLQGDENEPRRRGPISR